MWLHEDPYKKYRLLPLILKIILTEATGHVRLRVTVLRLTEMWLTGDCMKVGAYCISLFFFENITAIGE